jgi:Uma2 family endonuclease
MTAAISSTRLTPDDLLRLDDEGLFELVDGKLVEKPMSRLSSLTAARITTALSIHSAPRNLGDVLPEQTFRCFPHERDRVRRPDVAFIIASRTIGLPDEGHLPIAPDIAVEVISPTDLLYDLDEKLADYRAAGVKLVWVVNPNSRTVRIHRLDHTVTELTESDTLRGESVLPEFAVLVSELLPPISTQSR